MMDKYELQRLRELPIEAVAERLGLDVVRHKSLCPFHDDHHASLSFHVGRNTCRCFACMDKSMGPIDLVMHMLRKPFREACEWLSPSPGLSFSGRGEQISRHSSPHRGDRGGQEAGSGLAFDPSRYVRFFEHPFLSEEAQHFLFAERRIDQRVVRWCRLTSWRDRDGVSWLQIPYYDMNGQLIGVQNRNLGPSPNLSLSGQGECSSPDNSSPFMEDRGGQPPRFRFPCGSRCSIYNLPVLRRLRPGDELWITEGCSDCWAMLSSGRKAIAIPSATLLTPKDKELLAALSNMFQNGAEGMYNPPLRGRSGEGPSSSSLSSSLSFHMCPDNDLPGERLFLQLREVLPTLVRHTLPPDCKDFGCWWASHGTPKSA